MEQLSYTRQLLMQLNLQRSEGHLCDVVIVVENVLFRAHKNVLAACSGYFKCLVLRDNLITLNTQTVKPSVFQQVLDFIYTGQLSASHHATDQGVCELLRAASYLQLSDLAAVCLRKLKPCWSDHWSWSSLSTRHLQVGYSHLSGSTEVEKSHKHWTQRVDLSEQEHVSVNWSSAGGTASRLQQNSPRSSSDLSDHAPLNSSSAFYNRRLEHSEHRSTGSQQTAHKRLQSSREDCLQGTKSHGDLIQAEWRVLSELEDHVETPEEDLVQRTKLQIKEESRCEDKEQDGYVSHQPALCMCIMCGKSFPNSEQLVVHVDTHSAAKLRVKHEEGNFTETEDQDSKDLPSRNKNDRTTPLHPRPFSCDVCGQLFTQKGTMMRHRRSHLGLKPFACEECGMRFTRQYRKIEHMRIHTGEKPYECPICGAKFAQRQSVINHSKMHTGVS